MTSNPAPSHDPGPDHGGIPTAASGRTVAPVADGVAPAPSAARQVDWSGDPQAAVVGRLVQAASRFDRVAAELVEALVRALDSDAAEATLGVPVEVLLAQTCRHVGFERTTLVRVATTLARMPAVRLGFSEGWISWSQVRAIVTATGRVDVDGRARIDDLVADLAVGHADVEADHLVWEVDWLTDQLVADAHTDRDSTPVADNRLVLTPRLDGSGSLYGDYDDTHFTPLVEAIDHHADTLTQPNDPDGSAAEPAHDPAVNSAPDLHDPDTTQDQPRTEAHRHAAAMANRRTRRRADALFELTTARRAGTLTPLDPADPAARGQRVPSVLLTCHVDALIDGTTPGWVLSRLAGRMRVTTEVATRWVADGAATRLVAFDDIGQVVGVGRRTRVPPGWLRDAVIARDLHDTAPASTTAARHCDVDHVTAWPDGPTNVDNLGLLSRRAHGRKTRKEWHLDRHGDGSRTWTVPRTGYTIHQPSPSHLPTPTHDHRPTTDRSGGKDPPTPRGP